MILFTNITAFIIENVKNSLHVSGEITDTRTKKVFSFRGKATVIPDGENDVTFHSLKQLQEHSVDQKEIVVVKVESAEEMASTNSNKTKMSYDNLWKF